MFFHRVYGLSVVSNWRLRSLPEQRRGVADVRLCFGRATAARSRCGKDRSWFYSERLEDGSRYLRWKRHGEFLIDPEARYLQAHAYDRRAQDLIETYLLSHVLSFVLLARGREVTHATVALVDGRAVGFLGASGRGKSTLGSFFHRMGHEILTDDCLVTAIKGDRVHAFPGPRRLKLFPSTSKRVLGSTGARRSPIPGTRKLLIPLVRPLSRPSYPLDTLYVLGSARRDKIEILPLSPSAAVVALLSNTFNRVVTEPKRLRSQLEHLTELSRKIRVKELRYPRHFDLLPLVHEAVLQDVRDR